MKVKFKGKIYADAWRSGVDGHIWFGGNAFEHVPVRRLPHSSAFTYIHTFKPSANNTLVRSSKKSSAKLEILEEG